MWGDSNQVVFKEITSVQLLRVEAMAGQIVDLQVDMA